MEEVVSYLIKLSEAKLQLLDSLFKLSLKQEKALNGNDLDMLNQVLDEKQDVIKRVDILDKEFLDKYNSVKKELGVDSFEGITEEPISGFNQLQGKIREILRLVDKIRSIDEINIKQAKTNIEESKRQLKSAKIGKKAYSSYSKKPMEGTSIFIDKKE